MSERFILTQNLTILKMDKVQLISVVGGVIEDENTHDELDGIAIIAVLDDSDKSEVELGIYLTEEQASDAINNLSIWLSENVKNEYNPVFRMPPFDLIVFGDKPVDGEQESAYELDYSLPDDKNESKQAATTPKKKSNDEDYVKRLYQNSKKEREH